MIVESKVNHVERSQQFEENNFSIKASSGIFKILRDSLYSDPILAILREYAANGADSHTSSNQRDRPIEINLPSVFDPVLKIRDFGYGLSHEDMFQVFCVYGESTKKDSNDVIGYFGVGAKVGFAYSASFQIISIHKGIKSIYNAYLDESECGKLALLTQFETTEEQGIEISINVNQNDINTFVSTAQNLFKFWKPYPIFTGNTAFKETKVNYFLVRDNEWGFMNVTDSYNKGSGVVMGNIFYKVEVSKIPDLTELQKKVLDKSLVIFANIGDVVLQASRESVNYSPITIKFIKSRLKTIEDEIRAEADKKQATLTSEWDARKLYFDLFNTAGQFGVLAELFKTYIEVRWDNKVITTPNFTYDTFDGFYAKEYSDRVGKQRIKVEEENNYHGWPIIQMSNQSPHRLFYDLTGMGKGKIRNLARHYIHEEAIGEDENIYVIQPNSIEELQQVCIGKGIDVNLFKDVNTSITLPKKPKAPRQASATYNCRAYDPKSELDYEDMEEMENGMTKVNVDFNECEGGYYLLREYSNYYYGSDMKGANYSPEGLHTFLTQLDPEFAKHPVIYTFSIKKAHKLGPQWRRIDTALSLFLAAHYANLITPKPHIYDLQGYSFVEMLRNLAKKIKMQEINDLIDSINFDERDKEDRFKYLANSLGVKAKDVKEDNSDEIERINKEICRIKEIFPMCKFMSSHEMDDKDSMEIFAKYAQLILERNNVNKLDEEPVMS